MTASLENRPGTSSSERLQQLSWFSIFLGCFPRQAHVEKSMEVARLPLTHSYLWADTNDNNKKGPKHRWAASCPLCLPSRRVLIAKLNTTWMCLTAARNVVTSLFQATLPLFIQLKISLPFCQTANSYWVSFHPTKFSKLNKNCFWDWCKTWKQWLNREINQISWKIK